MHICNHCLGIRNRHLGICDHHVGIDRQFDLKGVGKITNVQQINRTHVEDMKNPDKILLPRGELVLVALREDESINRIPFTLLDHLSMDPGHRSAVVLAVNRSSYGRIIGLAHVVRFPIASRTDLLSPSNRFPFNLW
jgi:hypothetical protein